MKGIGTFTLICFMFVLGLYYGFEGGYKAGQYDSCLDLEVRKIFYDKITNEKF